MKYYYVSTDRGCGIKAARDEDHAYRQAARQVGDNNIQDVREATEADIAWVRGMGGYVPQLKLAECRD